MLIKRTRCKRRSTNINIVYVNDHGWMTEEGTGCFTVGDEVFSLSENAMLVMPKDIPHAVYGEEKFKIQLIVSF